MGCFQGPGTAGRLQHGSAWWFNDHKPGMEAQLTTLAAGGLLGNFIGMLTDSRSSCPTPGTSTFDASSATLSAGGWRTANSPMTPPHWSGWWPGYPIATASTTSVSSSITYGGQIRYEYDQRQRASEELWQARGAQGHRHRDPARTRWWPIVGPSGCGKSTFLRTLNRMNDLIPS